VLGQRRLQIFAVEAPLRSTRACPVLHHRYDHMLNYQDKY